VDVGPLLGGLKMRWVQLISLVVCIGMAAPASAGDLWVICAPELEIFLDGESVGMCGADASGKRVPGIETGDHTIQVRREGSASAVFPFAVSPASAQMLVPEVEGDPSGTAEGDATQKLGSIELTSNPMACKVGSGDRAIAKHQPIMIFVGVPFGKHRLQFEDGEKVLVADVPVQTHEPVQVRVDFSTDQVAIIAGSTEEPANEPAAEDHEPNTEPECIEYWAQVTRVDDEEEIEPVQDILEDAGFPAHHQRVVKIEDDGVLPLYKLYVGPIERIEKAKWVKGLLRHAGFKSVLIVPEECKPRQRGKREFKPIR
jgi:hypothetical protein